MKKLLIITLSLISFLSVLGQEKKLIPREVFFNNDDQRKEVFKLNPEGDKVFYFKNIYVPGNDIFAFDVKTKTEQKYSFDDAITEFYIFSKGRVLLNFRNQTSQYFSVYNLESKKLERLEPFPLQRSKIYDINTKTDEAVTIVIGQNNEKGIYKFNLKNKFEEIRKPEGFTKLFFDQKLNIIAGEKANKSLGKSFYYLKNNEWHLFSDVPGNTDMTVRGVNNILSVSNNGNKIYYSDNTASDITQLAEYDINKQEKKILLSPTKADIIPTSIIFDDNKRPISVVSLYGKPIRLQLPNSGIQEDIDMLSKEIKELHFLDANSNNKIWLVENMTGGANEYFLYNRKTKEVELLFNDYPVLDDYPKNIRHSFEVSSFDGTKLPINVYIRKDLDWNQDGIPDKPLPTILYVHGGPWIGWQNNNWLITRNLQLLANRGYAVIYSDFRGAVTYGKEFIEKSNNQWGDAMIKDKKAIANWAVKKEISISDKVGIFGWSYGGYAAMAGLALAPDTYACGIAMYGISDLESFLKTDFANNDNWKNRVADINTTEGLDLAKKHSPINYINNIESPLFLTTGGKDRRIETIQSEKMANKLTKANKKITYLYYPDEGHDYRNPDSWISFWAYAEEFLSDNLGGEFISNTTDNYKTNFEVKYKIKTNKDAIVGKWSGPGDMTFEVKKEGNNYIAKVVNPGKITILNSGFLVFNVEFKGGKYVGEYRRYFEGNNAKDDPCTLNITKDGLVASYAKIVYKKVG